MIRPQDALLAYRLLKYRTWPWLPAYRRDRRAKRDMPPPQDVLVCMTDHFEPPRAAGPKAYERVVEWVQAYRDAVAHLPDHEGRLPQHTFFYRFDFLDEACVRELAFATWEGLGEIEFHLHHGNDNEASFRERIRAGLALGARHGAMLGHGLRSSFSYIAGNWALNNGAGNDALSGCDNEIGVLRDEGCYGDFTYPALGSVAQPRRVNSIHYADLQRRGREAYEQGPDARVGAPVGEAGFLMVDGPLLLNRRRASLEYASVEHFSPYRRHRIADWIEAGVGVAGRPEWRVVKLHTHGIQSRGEYRGKALTDLYADLLDWGVRQGCRVHFVTARELVNIVRAAEQGCTGDAGLYRDHQLPPPPNRILRHDAALRVTEYGPGRLVAEAQGPLREVQLRLGATVVRCSADSLHVVDVATGDNPAVVLSGAGDCEVARTGGQTVCKPFVDGRVTFPLGTVAPAS